VRKAGKRGLKIHLKLEGSLYWYEGEKRKELPLEVPDGSTYRDAIEQAGLPLSEIAFVSVSGKNRNLEDTVKDGETVLIMPVIGGG